MVVKLSEARELTKQDLDYKKYIDEHTSNVKRTWNEILKPVFETTFEKDVEMSKYVDTISQIIDNHDNSKYSNEEYGAYRDYFYPKDGKYRKDDDSKVPDELQIAFDLAWNHHQKHNPHHWQYWILLSDKGEQKVFDMPLEYVIEMLCDWHSFSAKNPESTAYNWYNDKKDIMVLSDGTKKLISQFIDYLKEPLT